MWGFERSIIKDVKGKECTESNGINSKIYDSNKNLKSGIKDNKSNNDKEFFDEDISEEENIYKISKNDFFKIYSSDWLKLLQIRRYNGVLWYLFLIICSILLEIDFGNN